LAQAQFREGLTFDDVLLAPGASSVHPNEVDLSSQLTPQIRLRVPIVSSPMDTVTEYRTAITMAQEGGIGFLHKNLTIEAQTDELAKVKRSESGMIVDPITMEPEQAIHEAIEIMHRNHFSGLPLVRGQKLVGIVTNRDLRFVKDMERPVSSIMTSGDSLITVKVGVTLERAKDLLHENRIEKLLVTDDVGNLRGLITIKDIEKAERFPHANKDPLGRLRVGGTVGVARDCLERAEALISGGADVLLVDVSHGHAESVLRTLDELHSTFPETEIIGGNVATAEGAEALIKAKVAAVRCGVGPGSICTTRIVAGVGIPQLTAILDAAKPGDVVLQGGRSYKVYRAMGSLSAMRQGARDRYFQEEVQEVSKLVPEGVEARVPHRGPLSNSLYQLVGGVRSGMGLVGAANLEELVERARFVRISAAGLRESHPHDVIITEEPPNYWLDD
jgi:IMP dehydrogenase